MAVPTTWQELAQAASVEPDSQKFMHLIEQLNQALDEKDTQSLRSRAA
jgi:hypothetical protein